MHPLKLLHTKIVGLLLIFGASACASVVINSPTDGDTVDSPVQLNATSTGQRQPAYMRVYDNSALIYQRQGVSQINTSLSLTAGDHVITVSAQYGRSSSSSTSTITVSSPEPPDGGSSPSGSVAAQIAGDMQGRNEGNPHGVPLSYDWANGPTVTMGNNSNGWRAITAWGVVYEAAEGNPATNTRVNIRNIRTLFLQKSSGKWLLLQNTSTPDGAAYREDFSGDDSKPADIRHEPDGTISVTAGGGYNFHFYPSDRASINPKT
jgi:hypothetical protein